jgi:hypothetical protein
VLSAQALARWSLHPWPLGAVCVLFSSTKPPARKDSPSRSPISYLIEASAHQQPSAGLVLQLRCTRTPKDHNQMHNCILATCVGPSPSVRSSLVTRNAGDAASATHECAEAFCFTSEGNYALSTPMFRFHRSADAHRGLPIHSRGGAATCGSRSAHNPLAPKQARLTRVKTCLRLQTPQHRPPSQQRGRPIEPTGGTNCTNPSSGGTVTVVATDNRHDTHRRIRIVGGTDMSVIRGKCLWARIISNSTPAGMNGGPSSRQVNFTYYIEDGDRECAEALGPCGLGCSGQPAGCIN